MRLETSTAIIIGTATVALALWDIYAKVRQPDGKATESWLMRCWAKRWPIVAVVWGVLTGHFFWSQAADCSNAAPALSNCTNVVTQAGAIWVCAPPTPAPAGPPPGV